MKNFPSIPTQIEQNDFVSFKARTTMKILNHLTLFCLLSISTLFMLACSDREENLKRAKLAIKIKSEIEYYYNQNGFYPESLDALPISTNTDFISYYKGSVFRYRAGKGDNPWYHFIWVTDGILRTKGSDHGLSWNGKQCGSDKAHLRLLSEDSKQDSNGFFDIDLH
jgi:hypothetical protein